MEAFGLPPPQSLGLLVCEAGVVHAGLFGYEKLVKRGCVVLLTNASSSSCQEVVTVLPLVLQQPSPACS